MANADPHRPHGKTYVLVHGGFHGGWCWKDVTARLRALGHTVFRPTQTGLGERSHLIKFDPTLEVFIEDITHVIQFEELTDVILVGHSFAGPIISAVADRMKERLRHLVYLDANILKSGQCPADLPSPEVLEQYKQRSFKLDNGVTVLPPLSAAAFGITDPEQAAWFTEKLTPQPFRVYFDRLELKHELGNGVPATYIACTEPLFPNTARSRELAKTLPGWTYLEIPTAHDAMLLKPAELTEMLAAIE